MYPDSRVEPGFLGFFLVLFFWFLHFRCFGVFFIFLFFLVVFLLHLVKYYFNFLDLFSCSLAFPFLGIMRVS